MSRYVNANLAPIYLNSAACEQIKRMPTADVQEVRHGRWEVGYFRDRVCSCCTHPSNDLTDYPYKYCPNCGAKMEDNDVRIW